MKTREELQDHWERIVDKGFKDYNSLTREERIWFNLEPLTTDGIFFIYTNEGAENILDIIEDLEFLNHHKISALVKKMNKLFPNNTPPKNVDDRNEIIENWTEKQESKMEDIDDEFWEFSEDLEETLIVYLNNVKIFNL